MAALTPVSPTPLIESLGSLRLMMVDLVTGSQSDTYTIESNSPVVRWWCEASNGNGINDPDVTWTPSTGVFLLTNSTSNANGGLVTLFVLMRT